VGAQAEGDGLDGASRARARQLAPQHRRQGEADEIVEGAARQVGVDQGAVDLARVLHRLRHRLLGDGVEHHALDVLLLQRALFLQYLEDVPGNGLAFAVGVGGEDELFGVLDGLGDVGEPLLRLGIDLPDHMEVGVRIDRPVLGRQVADMAEGRQDLIAGPEVLVDRFRLGGRLDNDNVHENTSFYRELAQNRAGPRAASATGRWVRRPRMSNRKVAAARAEGMSLRPRSCRRNMYKYLNFNMSQSNARRAADSCRRVRGTARHPAAYHP